MTVINLQLTTDHFGKIRHLLHTLCGINLAEGKEALVKARLLKRLRVLSMGSFEDYMHYVEGDSSGRELAMLVDVLTTNKTSFFREMPHFDFLHKNILPTLQKKNKLRIWSAACSSGEEPYSIAIQLHDSLSNLGRRDVRILATDISTTMVDTAQEAIYPEETLADIPDHLKPKYFSRLSTQPPHSYRVVDKVRQLVGFSRLNLMGPWPMKGPFDIIFCRNVMIYFDKATKERLIRRFYDLLAPGAYLFIGHSESLSGISHAYNYVQPAIYMR